MWKPIALTLSLCVAVVTSQLSAEECFDDLASCLPQFRAKYLDIDYFSFGTEYSTCPGGIVCNTRRTDLQSAMSRVLFNNNTAQHQAAAADIQLLNVTFERPASSYQGCDHTFHIEAKEPATVPALGPFVVPLKTLSAQPHVTWTPRTPQTLYTYILYDASALFLHCIIVNCPGGSIAGGEVVRPWSGPGIPTPRNSAYVHLVFEQTATVDLQAAIAAVQTASVLVPGPVQISEFQTPLYLSQLSTSIDSDIKFSVIMNVYTDAYGARLMSDVYGLGNTCPLLQSQLPLFHAATQGMRLPNLQWSPPIFSTTQISTLPYLTTLEYNVKVTYDTDDYTDTVCCQEYSATRGSYVTDPYDTRPWRPVVTRDAPRATITILNSFANRLPLISQMLTLLMVDVTPAVNPAADNPLLYTHWLVTNIFFMEVESGTEVVPYFGPNPPTDFRVHTYMFLLFAQNDIVFPATLAPFCPGGFLRCRLRPTDVIETWNLGDLVGASWFQARRDDFALKRLNTVFGQPMDQVCSGREGYASPCPVAETRSEATCETNGQTNLSGQTTKGYLLGLAFALTLSRALKF